MDYCVPLGIPHSVFLSWDEDDQDAALVWQAEKRITCQECGTRPDEWDAKQGGDPDAYTGYTDRCQGCRELGIRRKEQPKDEEGLRTYLIPTAVAEQMHRERLEKEAKRRKRNPSRQSTPKTPNHSFATML